MLFAVVLVLTAGTASAQTLDSLRLRAGDPVRFPGPLPGQATLIDGTVVSVLPYAFEFRMRGDAGTVYTRTYESLTSIDVGYHDPGQSAKAGGFWGLFVGSALGLVAGPFLASRLSLETGPAMALTAAGGGLVGGGVGAATGAMLAPIRWNRYVFRPLGPVTVTGCPAGAADCGTSARGSGTADRLPAEEGARPPSSPTPNP